MANSSHSSRPAYSSLTNLYDRALARVVAAGPAAGAVWILGLVVAVLLGSGLGYPLVFGDYALLTAAKLGSYGTYWPVPGTPWLSDTSFGGWSRLAGRDWPWHRMLNLAFHGTAVVFAYAIGRRVLQGSTGSDAHPGWVAFLAAALFALHPAAVFTESYLAARPLLLQGLFSLVALWAVLRAAGEGWRGVWWLAPLACMGAMLASPAALGLPLATAIAAHALTPARRWGPAWAAVTISIVLAIAYFAWWATHAIVADGSVTGYMSSLGENAWRWLRGMGYAIVPITAWMAIDMPEPAPAAPAWLAAASATAFAGLLAASILGSRRPAWRVWGVVCGMLAALSFSEIAYPGAWAAFAPWRSYPWLALLCIVAAMATARLRLEFAFVLGTTAIVVCAILAFFTLRPFSTHMAAWDQAIRAAEVFGAEVKDARLYVNRGTLHRSEGHPLAAVADYERALALAPDFPRALRGRAQAYIDDRRYAAALKDLQRLLEVEPGNAGTFADIGLVHMQLGKFGEAIKSFNTAVEKGVREPKLFLNRGLALFQMGGLGAAPRVLDDIERALKVDPNYALAHFNRGLIFEQAAQAGIRLRDAVSPEIMRIVATQNIARACELGHRPACDLERERAAKKPQVEELGDAPMRLTPEMLRERGLLKAR